MLNTSPIGTHKTFSDYGDFLFARFIVPQWLRGSKEVHVIFDSPGRIPESPKLFERARCDDCATVLSNHLCNEITNNSQIPSKWRENFINCRRLPGTLADICLCDNNFEMGFEIDRGHLLQKEQFWIFTSNPSSSF